MPKRRRGSQARHHPGRRGPVSPRGHAPGSHAPGSRGHARFETLVDRAIAGIPRPFSDALSEVAIVIADEPTAEQLEENGLEEDETLYGLYEGVPRTEYAADWSLSPNKITLFRLPLEEDFADPDELADEVRVTVIHELAHHLGIDDPRLDELGV